jgi:hypothetical protein
LCSGIFILGVRAPLIAVSFCSTKFAPVQGGALGGAIQNSPEIGFVLRNLARIGEQLEIGFVPHRSLFKTLANRRSMVKRRLGRFGSNIRVCKHLHAGEIVKLGSFLPAESVA